MATSTLLQKLDGETEFGGSTSNRRTIETFLAGAALAAGDWVQFDTSQAGVAGAVVAGDLLVGPIGTAGEAAIFVPGTTEGRIIGEALAVDSPTGFGPVCVFRAY